MNKEFLSYSGAQIKLGISPSSSEEFVNKTQVMELGANPDPLAKYSNSEFVVDSDITLPISDLLFEYPGTYTIALSAGNYDVIMCGAGGSGANDGGKAGHASSGGNSGASLRVSFSFDADMEAVIVVGKGGVMTSSYTNSNGIDGGHSLFTIGNTTLVTTGGIGGCSYDGGSAAHAGNNIRIDNQIQQGTLLLSNPDPVFFTYWNYEPNRIGGHSARYSGLCTNSVGFSGPYFSFGGLGVSSVRYNNNKVTHICSSGTGGLNTYSGEQPTQNPGVNGGGSSNQGDNLAPLSESHGKWPGCGGGGRNFTADHTGMGGNGADGIIIIVYNGI